MLFSNADNHYKGLVLNTLTNEFLISLPKDHFFARSYLVNKDSLDNIVESYSDLRIHPNTKPITQLTWENESKPSYASASVLIDGNNWNLDDSLIGSLTSDLKHDTKSLRLRNLGFLVSEFPFEAGISTLHFSYGLFGSDPNSAIAVEYAYEWDPNTWHRIPFSLGDELAVTNNNSLESITLNININASIFLRIIKTNSSGRVNLDNIIINNCSHMITFNSNGGSSVEPIIQDFATPVFSPNNPILSGFTFGGGLPLLHSLMSLFLTLCLMAILFCMQNGFLIILIWAITQELAV